MPTKLFYFAAALALLLTGCNNAAETKMPEETPAEAQTETAEARLAREHALLRAEYADSVNRKLVAVDTFKGSARRMVSTIIHGGEISVNYGSPGKRGRVLWNGLVAYDQVWVSGSHWATAVTFGKPVVIAGTEVPAGTYGFFTIPGREQWTLILNKRYDQHLAEEYQEAEDLVRITVQPETLPQVVDRLTYEIQETAANTGAIALSWDQVRVAMPFEVR